MKIKGKILAFFCVFIMLMTGCKAVVPETGSNSTTVAATVHTMTETVAETTAETVTETAAEVTGIQESGSYYSKDEVAEYLHIYGRLPSNYITKSQAEKKGWDSKAGNLWDVARGCCIGGDRFGNREGLLPEKKGRTYYECDVNYSGGYRGSDRIIYSSDGLIYYTEDHYNSFEQLYE